MTASRGSNPPSRGWGRIGLNRSYTLGPLITAPIPRAYRRQRLDPLVRRLRIFASDPAQSRLAGNVVVVEVPYEPLKPGPRGALFEVCNEGPGGRRIMRRANLESHAAILRLGYEASEADPAFRQQMVYAVASIVHRTFRHALGRQLAWSGAAATEGRLRLYPQGAEADNAEYDPDAGELRFGFFRAETPVGRLLPGGHVYTALSHDVIAHELTHALLDGMRAQFLIPSGPDVPAFHEGFADVVALFHHFQYPEALGNALRRGRGNLRAPEAGYLHEIAQIVGRAGGVDRPLRSAVNERRYDPKLECHELGEVLLGAVYDAFCAVFHRKVARYVQLATSGSGILPQGEINPLLLEVLVDKAQALAAQFLAVLIRAVDYCPPVDLRFGEYLRAIVTADREMVPGDPWGFREAFVDSFRERGITLRDVTSLSEDALAWRPPRREIPPIARLNFGSLQFNGEPGAGVSPEEMKAQARALGDVATDPRYMREFGIVAPDDGRLRGRRVERPQIESIRTARRVGPDGRIVFDQVAEITQECIVPPDRKHLGFSYWGGSTVVIGPDGDVRYSILKSVLGEGRLERRREFLEQDARSARFWLKRGRRFELRGRITHQLHLRPVPAAAKAPPEAPPPPAAKAPPEAPPPPAAKVPPEAPHPPAAKAPPRAKARRRTRRT